MISSEQSRMARAALNWTAQKLAGEAGVGVATVNRFERGEGAPVAETVSKLCAALEAAGIEFIPENGGGAGVRLRK